MYDLDSWIIFSYGHSRYTGKHILKNNVHISSLIVFIVTIIDSGHMLIAYTQSNTITVINVQLIVNYVIRIWFYL